MGNVRFILGPSLVTTNIVMLPKPMPTWIRASSAQEYQYRRRRPECTRSHRPSGCTPSTSSERVITQATIPVTDRINIGTQMRHQRIQQYGRCAVALK